MTTQLKSTRRAFLAGSGALSFAVLAEGGLKAFRGEAMAAEPPVEVNAWVTIGADDQIKIRFASTEMGQGVSTALPMLLAEELDAEWTQVTVEQVDQGPLDVFGNPIIAGILYTAGSSSVAAYFDRMRRAGAQARRILIYAAAQSWNVAPDEIITRPSILVHAPSGRTMRYGEAVASPELSVETPPITPEDLKPQEAWRIIGSDLPRVDIPAKTRGEEVYSIDVRIPNMLYAAQLLAPVEGETPLSVNEAAARGFRGVVDVVALKNSVNVIAETLEGALAARDLLEVKWSETSAFRSADSAAEMAQSRAAAEDLSRPATLWNSRADAAAALANAGDKTILATFTTDHLYHAQMEPLSAIAAVDPDGKGAEVWIGTQSQTVAIGVAAGVLQTTPDRIRLHAMTMGGGFGRRTVFARELLRDALLLSRTLGRPVKLIWTREDDVKNGWFRPITAHHFTAALNAQGDVTAWRHRLAAPSVLKFSAPHVWEKTKGRDLLVMEGAENKDYDMPNLLAEHVVTERRSRIAAWRGIGWGSICFARECFIDELAQTAGAAPADFRRKLLAKSPRGLGVLDAVLEMSDFGAAPEGRAHGLSFAGYKETRGAGVAEVSIQDGAPRVHRFWAAVDPGIAIHPKNLIAQVEGGVIYGLSGLMRERVSIQRGEVAQSNFYDYDVMRMDEAPQIEVQIVKSGAAPSGAGEIGVPMTGAAVANALFALTGARVRDMPFS